MQQLNPDATAVYVAGNHAAAAIEEAVEAEIPLIVAVSDHVPLHDMIRVFTITLDLYGIVLTRTGTINTEKSVKIAAYWS